MDVGDPSNFERMQWLYRSDLEAMRHDVTGIRYTDDEVRATIKRVYDEWKYLLDPHSAIAYMGVKQRARSPRDVGIFLATAHPAKFAEIVEPIIGQPVEVPGPLADALSRPRHLLQLDASLEAVAATLAAE